MKRLLPVLLLLGCPTAPPDNPPPDAEPPPDLLPLGDALAPLGELRPQPQGSVHLNDIVVVDGVAWMPGHGSVYVVDVSDPAAPEGIADAGSQMYRVAVDGDRAVVSGRARGVRFIGLDNGQLLAGSNLAQDGYVPGGVALTADHVLIGTTGDGLEVRDRQGLELIGSVAGLTNVVDVANDGQTVVAVDRDAGLAVIDMSEPAAPTVLGSVALPGSPQGVALQDGIAYVAASGSLAVVDVRTPESPALLADVLTDGVATRVDVDGDFVALANWFDTRVYDVADPGTPRLVAVEEAQDSAMAVAIEGDVVYVGDWDWLRTYRIDASVGAPDVSGPAGVSVSGGAGSLDGSFRLDNVGDRPLIATLSCDDTAVAITPQLTVDAHDGATVDVHVESPSSDPWTATCTVASNDPDEPTKEVLVDVNPEGLEVGDPAPDWTLPDLAGVSHSLSAQQGNVVMITLFSGL